MTTIVVGVLVVLREPVVVISVVVRALACAGAVIDTFAEVLTRDMRVDALSIDSDLAVELLMDAMTGVLTNIGFVDVLFGVNVRVFAGVMAAFEFAMPDPSEEFRCCWAAFDCRPMFALDCANAFLQA